MAESDNLTRRRFLQATGGAAGAAALAGCGGNSNTTTTSSSGGNNSTGTTTTSSNIGSNTYSMINSSMTTLDPVAVIDQASTFATTQIFEGLTHYPNGETDVKNLLAKDYSVSSDGTTYTFDLTKSATFSNGNSVTAKDFVYSWERLAASNSSKRSSFLLDILGVKHDTTQTTDSKGNKTKTYKPGSLGVTAVDSHTLKVELEKPFFAALELTAFTGFAVIPEGIIGDIKGYSGKMSQSKFAKNPVGSGPFTLDKWQKSVSVDLKARSDYWSTGPKVDGVHMQILEKDNAIYTYTVVNENADNPTVPSSKWDSNKVTIKGTDDRGRKYGTYGPLENGLTVPYYQVNNLVTYWLAFNCNTVNKKVRQAIAYAINQPSINKNIFKGRYKPAYTFLPPGLFPGGASAQQSFAKQNYPYGYGGKNMLGKAQSIMENAGYSQSKKYKLNLAAYQGSTYQQLANLLRDKLSSAHIDVSISQPQFSTMLTQEQNGSLDAYTAGWGADYPAAPNFLQLLYPPDTQTSNPSSSSYYNWGGTSAAKNATSAWKTIQNNNGPSNAAAKKRANAYKAMEKAWMEDAVVVPLFYQVAHHMDYPWLNKQRAGAMGSALQRYNKLTVGNRSKYQS